ncbi:thiolase family protein [Desertimonas flava]|uniref:thiolase family protein n=1 Tax=Desertimonas flava TaxID=2064846 RepID=UPI000E348702|nr:thiolase family protein [Desertimonas flava]
MTNEFSARAAIVGLGTSAIGRVYGKSSAEFAADAVAAAVADAGLSMDDIDGVLTTQGRIAPSGVSVAATLGLRDLTLEMVNLEMFGASTAAAVQYAAMAIQAGMARNVVYVHADAPLKEPGASGGAAYGSYAMNRSPAGFPALDTAIGLRGANEQYALFTRRHMEKYGTTSEQLGAIAVAQREWATMNPMAQMRTPITIEDHQNSRWIAEPLHLLDCCLVSNGAVAVVITAAERAPDLQRPPVYIWGWGQGHLGHPRARGSELGLVSGAGLAGRQAFAMAGIGLDDIDVREFYDCYTFTVLLTLEDYGFVPKGDGGPFAATGELGPGGSMPTNTGGGQLSAFYLVGTQPLYESVVQVRGDGGDRQVARHDFALCSGQGGILEHHATLILGAHPRD